MPTVSNSETPDQPVTRSEFEWAMDRRITILETRFDTILPTLATKADLAELRAELKGDVHSLKADISKWLVGIVITLFFGFGGMFFTMLSLLRPS